MKLMNFKSVSIGSVLRNLLACSLSVGIATTAVAATQDCGSVYVEQILTGPRHQSMLKVSNRECGLRGYVCIDPTGEYTDPRIADYMFSFVLAQQAMGKPMNVTVNTGDGFKGCGYDAPYIEDIRN